MISKSFVSTNTPFTPSRMKRVSKKDMRVAQRLRILFFDLYSTSQSRKGRKDEWELAKLILSTQNITIRHTKGVAFVT
jgi:hypothetical protein